MRAALDWKQALLPRRVGLARKRAKRRFATVRCWAASVLFAAGRPTSLAAYLRKHELPAKVVGQKQHILYLATEDRFLRYARRPRAVAKLRRELAGWEALKAQGLGQILPRTLRLEALGPGILLESERLRPVTFGEQLAATIPIIAALADRARPAVAGALPPTVESGLALARSVAGGSLPATFADEPAIRAAFARPLRIGPSHQDLHGANVMRDEDGRSVLIDLKSYGADRVLAIDVLTFACKYLAAREGFNLVDQAFAAQRRGWEIRELAPVLAFIDLPRQLWGPIFVLYCFGRMASKSSRAQNPNAVMGRLLANLLARDWRLNAAAAVPTVHRSAAPMPRPSGNAAPEEIARLSSSAR